MKKDCPASSDRCSDRRLVSLARGGDEQAFSMLADRYMPTLQGRAGRYANIVGVDVEDFVQEGMLALFRAVRRYNMDGEVQFNTYAITCINNAMSSAIKSHMKGIHKESDISLDGLDDLRLRDIPLQSREVTLEEDYLSRESSNELAQLIETLLSKFERRVLSLYLNGYTYQQTAEYLSTTTKAVDNALQRVRRKLRPGSQKPANPC